MTHLMLNHCQWLSLQSVSGYKWLGGWNPSRGHGWRKYKEKIMENDNKEQNSGTVIVQKGSGITSLATTETDVTTTTSTTFGSGNAELISFNFDKESKTISVVFREKSMVTLGNGQPMPDRVWKELYVAENDEIVLKSVKNGIHEHGYYVNETFNFDD